MLQVSKKAFSKSVDDLTSVTRQDLLAGPVNRSRKSIYERRKRRDSLKGSPAEPLLRNHGIRDAMPTSLPGDAPQHQHAQINLPPSFALPAGLAFESIAALLSGIDGSSAQQGQGGLSGTPPAKLEAPFAFPTKAFAQRRTLTKRQSSSMPTCSTIAKKQPVVLSRESQIVRLQGLLQRKTDYRSRKRPQSRGFSFYPSPSSGKGAVSSATQPDFCQHVDLTKGWKAFFATLRGTYLYLYKIPLHMCDEARAIYRASWDAASTLDLANRIAQAVEGSPTVPYTIPLVHCKIKAVPSSICSEVFEVETEEGEIAILQATSDAERQQWMKHVEELAERVANKRASYIEPVPEFSSATDDAAPDDGTPGIPPSSTQCFAIKLEDLLHRDGTTVPWVITTLLAAVEQHGFNETGIYRVSGDNRVVQAVKDRLNG